MVNITNNPKAASEYFLTQDPGNLNQSVHEELEFLKDGLLRAGRVSMWEGSRILMGTRSKACCIRRGGGVRQGLDLAGARWLAIQQEIL